MSSVVGGNPEVETFLSRLIEGKFEIDTAHPDAKAYQNALDIYRKDKMSNAVPTPRIGEYMRGAIYTAISKGVIKPRGEDVAKLSREIIDKKLTERDVDRAEGDITEKNSERNHEG
jgi:hypothetical protein